MLDFVKNNWQLNAFLRVMNMIETVIIIMDNLEFKNPKVRYLIESKGHTTKYLPTYSPFLNPIENMFSQIKFAIKSIGPRNQDNFFAIETGSRIISEKID